MASIDEAADLKGEPVCPVLRRLAVVEKGNGGVRSTRGEEEADRRKDDQPEVAEDDDSEEVAREVQAEQRRPAVGVPVDGRVHVTDSRL
jgi:hypothetical protein